MNPRSISLTVMILVSLFTAAVIPAASFVPAKTRAPDEFRCLTNLESVLVSIDELPSNVQRLDAVKLRELFRDSIAKRGFEIQQEGDGPRIALQFTTAYDTESAPGFVALTTIIGVYQNVNVLRLDDRMFLPVASVVTTAIGPEDKLMELMEREMVRTSHQLARAVVLAKRSE